MNITELKQQVKALGASKDIYSINDGLKPDAYILEEIYGKWSFFYFDERGNREDLREFASEDEACQYFLNAIKNELAYPSDI